MSDSKIKLVIMFLITALCGFIAWPSENKPGFGKGSSFESVKLNLGLDLQGGAWFRVRLKSEGLTPEEISKGTEEAQLIIDRRVNLRGLKEPRITRVGANEIQIEVPGLKTSAEVEQFKKVILSAGHLEFHLEADQAAGYTPGAPLPAGTRYYTGKEGGLLCKAEISLDGKAVEKATAGIDDGGRPAVHFTLTPEAGRRFEVITQNNIDRRLAIILDDRLVSSPNINSKIGREGIISGQFTNEQVSDMVTVLTTGALIAPLEMVGSSFVGASLGQDAVDRGMKACMFSLCVVMAFMLIYYRHAGLVANVAMAMNITMMMGILALFGATLTLPGIAGIVLTIGMAVDSNIIVFERMREEKEQGRSARQCLDAGYQMALSAILDANITTFLTGFILWYFGTGLIQGFAWTLMIGIMTTLITTLLFSKVMMGFLIDIGLVKEWKMMAALSKPKIKWLNLAPKAAAISAIVIVIGIVAWFARGEKKYGIDFRGGVAIQVRFNKPTPISEVRDGIAAISGPKGQKYPSAEVQSVLLGTDASSMREAMQFQIRTLATTGEESTDPEKFKNMLVEDLRKQFAGKIPSPAFETGQEKFPDGHPYAGGGTIRVSLSEPKPAKETVAKIQARLEQMGLTKPVDAPKHVVKALGADGKATAEEKATTYEIFLLGPDFADRDKLQENIGSQLRSAGLPMSGDPFPSVETVSASIVSELKEKAIIALAASWIVIILYLAIRFEFKYGVAAVVALVHDSVIAVTWTVLIDALLPKSLGIDLSVSLTTVAAALTVVGFSVNDTVVIYDRLRENLRDAGGREMRDLINDALNQTMSRTIITSLTVFFTTMILLAVTLTSGGGIAALSLPLLIGVVVGCWSTVFIAVPILYWWKPKKRDAVAEA